MARNKKKKQGRSAILIFVEGETEQAYFNSFKKNFELYGVAIVSILKGSGDWIDKAKNQARRNPKYSGYKATNIFVIFDKNGNTKEELEDMFEKAKSEGVTVGFSNNSIEVWLLAHFEQINRGFKSQRELERNLTSYLGTPYVKGNVKQIDKIVQNIRQALYNTSNVTSINLDYQTTNISDIINEIWSNP